MAPSFVCRPHPFGSAIALLAAPFLIWRRHSSSDGVSPHLAMSCLIWQCHSSSGSVTPHLAASLLIWRRHSSSGGAIPLLAAIFLFWRRHISSGGLYLRLAASLFLACHRCSWPDIVVPRRAGCHGISPNVTPSPRTSRHLAGHHASVPEVTPARR